MGSDGTGGADAADGAEVAGGTGRRLISSGSPYEPVVGYSRAVVAGPHVFVSGTAPIMPDGADPPADAYGQAKRCFEIIGDALLQAGASFADVVRTRVYLTTADAFEGAGRAHGEVFESIRPANTTVIVAALLDPRWMLEIEVQAFVPDR
jgi:enamine deaminase RidA (YjgF/YER057c/UK114 family)